MSQEQNQSQNHERDQARAPKNTRDFDAYAVRNDNEGKGHFHKIGAAFKHKDGQGYDIDLVAAPTNGRVTLRTPKDRLDEARQNKQDGQNRRRGRSRNQERNRE